MKKPLSISGTNTYWECPAKFENHYIKRLRPIFQPSYFVFGSAMDKGFNALIMESGSPLQACEDELKRLVIEKIEFLPNDYDGDLIDEKTKEVLLEKCKALGYKGDDVDDLSRKFLERDQKQLSENQRKCLALCCAASLRAKAKLMFEAYRIKVVPLIKRVDSVQEKIEWTDSLGNKFVGVLDLPAEISGWGQVVADNKTASNPYRDYGPDSVRTSFQLAVYSKVTGKTKGAFFVLGKNIKKNKEKICSECGHNGTGKTHKKCDAILTHMPNVGHRCNGEWTVSIKPEAEVTVVIDDIPAEEQFLAQEALTSVAESIKKGCFPKNLRSCRQMYGKREVFCPYFKFCRTGSLDNLSIKDKEE